MAISARVALVVIEKIMNNVKHLLIDMDGTIAAYSSKSGKINISEFGIGFFINKQPVKAILKAIYEEFPSSEYNYTILSHSPHTEANIEKSAWLVKYFNRPIYRTIFVKYPSENKEDYVNQYIIEENITKNDIILIDDDHNILRTVERECGIQVYHPSYILTLNQKED